MSRVSDTMEMVEVAKEAMIGSCKQPVLLLIPVLCSVALNLAAIADALEKEDKK